MQQLHTMAVFLKPNSLICKISRRWISHLNKQENRLTISRNTNAKTKTQSRFINTLLSYFGLSLTCLGTFVVYRYGSPEMDSEGNPIEDEFHHKPFLLQYILRTYSELLYFKKLIEQPSRDKLLPDPLDYPYSQPKYTLILELNDVLVHPDWTYFTGWRFKKRPFLDYFLKSLKDSYEIVVYTAEQGVTAFPLVEAIDTENIIAYKLVRDATYFSGGCHVKSLDNLNRDLSKVVCVDWDQKNLKLNPTNLLKVKRWAGNDDDTSLIDLALLLKTIADNGINDVREVLDYYNKYEDPVAAFKEKQRMLIDQMEAHAAKKKEQTPLEKNKKWGIFEKKIPDEN